MQELTPNDHLKTRVALYTTIAGTLFAGAAQAGLMQSPNGPFTIEVDATNTAECVDIDVDGNAVIDFRLCSTYQSYCTPTQGWADIRGQSHVSNRLFTATDAYGGMISAGTAIPGALTLVSPLYLSDCYIATDFSPDTRGFLGFQFDIGGNTHNGYFDVDSRVGSLINTVTAFYESDPGVAVEAGQRLPQAEPIPVGGVIPLSLGMLALGASALRRRRKHLN